jgi:hypothetical protein
VLDELADLAPPLPDQANDGNICAGAACDIRKKRRFSYPRLAEYANALSPSAGEEAIESPDAERKRPVDARAVEGLGGRRADIAIGTDVPRRPRFVVEWFSEWVQNAPEQPPAYADTKTLPCRDNLGGARKPSQIPKRGQHGEPVPETDDLRLHPKAASGLHELANLTDPHIPDRRFDDDALKVPDAAFDDSWSTIKNSTREPVNECREPVSGPRRQAFRLRVVSAVHRHDPSPDYCQLEWL